MIASSSSLVGNAAARVTRPILQFLASRHLMLLQGRSTSITSLRIRLSLPLIYLLRKSDDLAAVLLEVSLDKVL